MDNQMTLRLYCDTLEPRDRRRDGNPGRHYRDYAYDSNVGPELPDEPIKCPASRCKGHLISKGSPPEGKPKGQRVHRGKAT